MADLGLTVELKKILTDYSKTTSEKVGKILEDVGKEAKTKLNETSPKKTGQYRKGWRVKVENGDGVKSVTVHNKNYYLTHLLENGHQTRNHKNFVAARVHIKPVEDWAIQEVEKRIKEELSK